MHEKYKAAAMKVAIHREQDNPAYDEGVTYIEVVDEGAGAYIELSQDDQKIRLNPEELDLIVAEAKRLIAGWPE